MELHELPSGVLVLNDAYNANPDSMRAALDALVTIGRDPDVKRTLAVLGEMKELGETAEGSHLAVGAYAAAQGVDQVLVVGDAARGIHEGVTGAGHGTSTFVADNDTALDWLRANLQPGDAVLFKASNGARLYDVASAL
jgi:UDP-N-acetylmuramoyl-tripeptide--D-alanyl-D-alanine ligase